MELKQDIEKEIIKLIISEYISTLYYIHLIVQSMYTQKKEAIHILEMNSYFLREE